MSAYPKLTTPSEEVDLGTVEGLECYSTENTDGFEFLGVSLGPVIGVEDEDPAMFNAAALEAIATRPHFVKWLVKNARRLADGVDKVAYDRALEVATQAAIRLMPPRG